MKKKEIAEYWRNSALHDMNVMDNLFKAKNYDWSLFFVHLIIEKILKAKWILDNHADIPPKTHNLEKLARETKLNLSEEVLAWLIQANDFNIETRYPDYKLDFYKRVTKPFAAKNIAKAKEIFKCIQKAMQ